MSFSGILGSVNLGLLVLGDGQAVASGFTTKTQQATASIQAANTRTQTCTASLLALTTHTQTATALINGQGNQNQSATAFIQGVGNIRNTQSTFHALLEGSLVANIRNTQSTFHVLLESWAISKQFQTCTADIRATVTKTQTGQAALGFLASHTQAAVANIRATTSRTQSAISFLLNRTAHNQPCVADILGPNNQSQNGRALLVQFVANTDGDTLALGITDASAITTGTIGSSDTSDTLALGITDASTLTTVTVVPETGSDTLTIGIIDGVPHLPVPSGLRVDELSIGIDDESRITVSGTGGILPLISPPKIMLATPRATATFDTYGTYDSNGAVDTINDVLVAAGWTSTPLSASGYIGLFSIPISTLVSPIPRIGLFDDYVSVDGVLFWFFDLAVESPNLAFVGVVWVQKGITDGSPTSNAIAIHTSAVNLAAAIQGSTTFNASVASGDTAIILLAKTPGTTGNNHQMAGTVGSGANPSGSYFGGYILISPATAPGGGPQTQLTFRVVLGDWQTVMIGVTMADGTSITSEETTIDSRVTGGFHLGQFNYHIWANPYQVLISPLTDADVPYHGGDLFVGNSSLFVCSPWISPNAAVTSCGFALEGYTACREKLQECNMVTYIDGTLYDGTLGDVHGYAMLVWNQDSTLQVWNDSNPTCYQDAVVMLSRGTQQYNCVGYIWDAFLTTEDGTDAPRGRAGTINYLGTVYNTVVMANSNGGSVATMYLITP